MKIEDQVAGWLRDSIARVSPPKGRLEDVIARARHRHRVRRLGALLAGAFVLAAFVVPLILLLPLSGGPANVKRNMAGTSTTEMIDVGGVRVSVPDSWYGRVFYLPGYTRPVFQLATFSLPDTTDIPATSARSLMGAQDVLLVLVEYSAICPCPGFDPTTMPLTIAPDDFSTPFDVWDQLPPQPAEVPVAHALARRTFEVNGRSFDLWIEFGQRPADPASVDRVNAVLASLSIGDYVYPTQPDGLCNQWSPPKDPDCPETVWLKSVLAISGFNIVDDPDESTLVGQVGADRFFIWTKPGEEPLADGGLPVLATIGSATLYGDGSQIVWRAQGLDVWVAPGPLAGDKIPGLDILKGLVEATTRTPMTGS